MRLKPAGDCFWKLLDYMLAAITLRALGGLLLSGGAGEVATAPVPFLSVSMCFHRRVCHGEDNTSGGTHGASGVRATTGCSDEWRGGKNLSTKVAKRAGTASEKDSVPNQDQAQSQTACTGRTERPLRAAKRAATPQDVRTLFHRPR